jgi:hypothetical protein
VLHHSSALSGSVLSQWQRVQCSFATTPVGEQAILIKTAPGVINSKADLLLAVWLGHSKVDDVTDPIGNQVGSHK